MSSAIPIQNLYYLLSYSWDDRVESADLENINADECPDLENFFARVLSQRLRPLLRRGLDRAYTSYDELTSQPRGRLDFSASAKRQTWLLGKMRCSYDDLSHDVMHNRIIKSTLILLYRKTRLGRDLKKETHELLNYFSDVRGIRITPRSFQRIQLHRNNKAYRFILHICELVHASLLPEHHSDGRRKFRRIETNERVMNRIFESFIYQFIQRNIPNVDLPVRRIDWQAEYFTDTAQAAMPTMNTDVTVVWKDSPRKLILDCKYYKDAFTERTFFETTYTRFKTENLYQMFSYLINKRETTDWKDVEGMLLYPSTSRGDIYEDMTLLNKHRLQICSINLNQDWHKIEQDLIKLITRTRSLTQLSQ